MDNPTLLPVLERQLLIQLGDRLRSLRLAQGWGTEVMAARVGVSRNTLRAVESGDPGTAIGTYVRAMSMLGVGGDMALLAGDVLRAAPEGTAPARSRRAAAVVEVRVSTDDSRHRLQDLQSLALHEEAVSLVQTDADFAHRARETLKRWLSAHPESRSAPLWREWTQIFEQGEWRKVLARTHHAQQLRQASPLVTALPPATREAVLSQVSRLKKGVTLGGPGQEAP